MEHPLSHCALEYFDAVFPPEDGRDSGADITKYRAVSERKVVDSELLFIERYADWLTPGGVAVTVVPDSILTNKDLHRRFRRKVVSHQTCFQAHW
jgi:type I restriction-modification system DNA methylase subunit